MRVWCHTAVEKFVVVHLVVELTVHTNVWTYVIQVHVHHVRELLPWIAHVGRKIEGLNVGKNSYVKVFVKNL